MDSTQEIVNRCLESDLFKNLNRSHSLPPRERAALSYQRAKAIGLAYKLTKSDLATLSEKFWSLILEPALCLDGAAGMHLTNQYNLVAGTLLQFQIKDPRHDVDLLIEDILQHRKIALFCLTELGHGLDIANLETTCTLLSSGEFCLDTPNPQAAKFMMASIPVGSPCFAIVFARLLVGGQFCGVRPFLVDINDGFEMCKGVSARLLPPRGGTNPVNHALTSFNKVILPSTALLGPRDPKSFTPADFQFSLARVPVGTIMLGTAAIPILKIASTIGAMYSARRHVGAESTGGRIPLIHFRTQQIPILTAIAQAHVLEAFHGWVTAEMSNMTIDPRIRHALAVIFKAVAIQHAQAALMNISERCGAQGLFGHNQMIMLHTEARAIAIAEGDILRLSLRFAIEFLLDRYTLPEPRDRQSLLALHEIGLFEQHKSFLSKHSHRSDEASRLLLPHCQAFIEAIGHRMAYDCAVATGVDKKLVDLYEASVVKLDRVWYSENLNINSDAQNVMEDEAISAVLPHLESLVRKFNCHRCVTAPIASDGQWDEFVDGLEVFQASTPDSVQVYDSKSGQSSWLGMITKYVESLWIGKWAYVL